MANTTRVSITLPNNLYSKLCSFSTHRGINPATAIRVIVGDRLETAQITPTTGEIPGVDYLDDD